MYRRLLLRCHEPSFTRCAECSLGPPAVWEVFMGGRKPYGALTKVQVMCGVVDNLRPRFCEGVPAWYAALAAACWAKSPRQR